MTSFTDALESKLSELQDEKEELQDSLSRVESKIELLTELLTDETGEVPEAPAPKKRGRPRKTATKKVTSTKKTPTKRGRKKKADAETEAALQAEYEEARSSLPAGTTPTTAEEQAKAVSRFRPTPRATTGYGGVRAGGKVEEVLPGADKTEATTRISIEDGE